MTAATSFKENLAFAYENNLNVLTISKHGCGKSEMTKQFCEDNNITYQYISASTCDPLDLVGLPYVVQKGRGQTLERNLEYIKPEFLRNIEVLIIDEISRADSRVCNALLELIQFKKINDTEVPNLKSVFALSNPHDDEHFEYDVEVLDQVLIDRFHLHITLPYEPNLEYFTSKYGSLGERACEWWSNLRTEQQHDCSPRRLDYALQIYKLRNTTMNVIPFKCNPGQLDKCLDDKQDTLSQVHELLERGRKNQKLKDDEILKEGDEIEELTSLLYDPNTFNVIWNGVISKDLKKYNKRKLTGVNKSNLETLLRIIPDEYVTNKKTEDKEFTKYTDYQREKETHVRRQQAKAEGHQMEDDEKWDNPENWKY